MTLEIGICIVAFVIVCAIAVKMSGIFAPKIVNGQIINAPKVIIGNSAILIISASAFIAAIFLFTSYIIGVKTATHQDTVVSEQRILFNNGSYIQTSSGLIGGTENYIITDDNEKISISKCSITAGEEATFREISSSWSWKFLITFTEKKTFYEIELPIQPPGSYETQVSRLPSH